MATQAVLTFSDGKLEVPEEVREELHLSDGMRVAVTLNGIVDTRVQANRVGGKRNWRSFQGMLKDRPEHDTTKARAAERAWELEHDERKYGQSPKS
jgi:hypothetical protein